MAAAARNPAKRKPGAAGAEAGFRSAAELREVLDSLLREADADPVVGPRLRAARVPDRLRISDLDLTLDIAPAEDPDRHVRWTFDGDIDLEPALTLEMDSAALNRYLQGRLNLVIAIARREVKFSASDPRAALIFLPLGRSLCGCYQAMIKRRYPHLELA